MPETVVGWCTRCWGLIGGGKFYIYQGMIYYRPIWDVLVPEGEQVGAGGRLYGARLIKIFPIRQAVPVEIQVFAPGLARLGFS
jgi:hypothetical protein